MRWAEISLETSMEAADAVSDILISEGCGGVAIADSSVRLGAAPEAQRMSAYYPVDDRLPATLENIKVRLSALADIGLRGVDTELAVGFVEDEDWATAWKSFFKPLAVGRIVIRPTWEDFDPQPGQIILSLDPGMAFGTGYHPTTQMCLTAVQQYVRPGDSVLDMGTGSGILAIAAALLGASEVVGVDIDPIAVKAAEDNAAVNGVQSRVRVLEGSTPRHAGIMADLAIANIVASAILEMKQELADALKPGGTLVVSGIIDSRAEEVEESLQAAGFDVVEVLREGEWVSIVSRNVRNDIR